MPGFLNVGFQNSLENCSSSFFHTAELQFAEGPKISSPQTEPFVEGRWSFHLSVSLCGAGLGWSPPRRLLEKAENISGNNCKILLFPSILGGEEVADKVNHMRKMPAHYYNQDCEG